MGNPADRPTTEPRTATERDDAIRVLGEGIAEIGMRSLSGDRDLTGDEMAAVAFLARQVLYWAEAAQGAAPLAFCQDCGYAHPVGDTDCIRESEGAAPHRFVAAYFGDSARDPGCGRCGRPFSEHGRAAPRAEGLPTVEDLAAAMWAERDRLDAGISGFNEVLYQRAARAILADLSGRPSDERVPGEER